MRTLDARLTRLEAQARDATPEAASGAEEALALRLEGMAARMTPEHLSQALEHPETVSRAEAVAAGGYTLEEVMVELGYEKHAREN